jgi:hypothetical protein
MKKPIYWNDQTIAHFKFESSYQTRKQTELAIIEFVEIDCVLEDDETEEMFVKDLINRVF